MAISKITGAGLSGAETIHDTIALNSIKQTDAQNLTGTYSSHELVMGKTFTLTGDVTVNENLVLANMSGVGTDIIIQDDGTARTINSTGGTGIIEGVSKAFTRTSLTGMTGALGSVVTGTPAITDAPALTGLGTVTSGTYNSTIGSSATFPAGHVIQTVTNTQSEIVTFGGTGYKPMTGMVVVITPKVSTSKILVTFSAGGSAGNSSISYISTKVTGTTNGTICENVSGYGHHTSGSWLSIPIIVRAIDLPGTVATQTYQLHMHSAGGSAAGANINYNGSNGTQPGIITAMEIAV